MSITQTVDIPASHRLTIDVPREVPVGRAILTFSVAESAPSYETKAAIETVNNEILTARLNEIYSKLDSSLEPCYVMAQAEVLESEDW